MAGSSSSVSAFVSSLIVYGIIGVICFILFSFLRPKQTGVYQPKVSNYIANRREKETPPPVAPGAFAWLPQLFSRSQSFLINYIGVDGYLYTRYIGTFAIISILTGVIVLCVLLPVNATGGNDLPGFELLSFANVKDKNRFYAHACISIFFFGSIVYCIYKELFFYTTFRHALQSTPLYNEALSSRTLLLTDIPKKFYDNCSNSEEDDKVDSIMDQEGQLREVFAERGLAVSKIWFAHDFKELVEVTGKRDKLFKKYEAALNKVVKTTNKLHKKWEKKDKPLMEGEELYNEVKQPKHSEGKIPFTGKEETIPFSQEKLPEYNEEIESLRLSLTEQKKLGSVFLAFESQADAQRAFQAVPFIKEFKGEAIIGVMPDDIIWGNLATSRYVRLGKKILANTFLTLMIIFWAIPVAIVGMISNITFLTEKISFLKFINNCPKVLLGLITGLLPTIALAVLMMLVPVIIKKVGKISGLVTKQAIDLYCQSWFFGFQVVQVFLVVTLASSASSTVTAIIDDPSSAMTLLSENLPKSSNFYLSYYLLQGLYAPAWMVLQAVPLALSHALAFLLNTPRKKWSKTSLLAVPSFGVMYPPLQLLIVIFACYAMIAPILMVFSSVALGLSYLVNLYIFVYVKGHGEFDQKGRNYPKALLQTFVGLYLAEICVLGLFVTAKAWGPIAIEAVVLAATVVAHLFFKWRFIPLFDNVPVSALSADPTHKYNAATARKEVIQTGKSIAVYDEESIEALKNAPETTPGQEFQDIEKQDENVKSGVLDGVLHPMATYSFPKMRSKLLTSNPPMVFNDSPVPVADEDLNVVYHHPIASSDYPIAWIPRDEHGVSDFIVATFADVQNDGAVLTKDGKLELQEYVNPPDYDALYPPPDAKKADAAVPVAEAVAGSSTEYQGGVANDVAYLNGESNARVAVNVNGESPETVEAAQFQESATDARRIV